jgi:sugar lactone lactonase YvrE
VWFWWPTPAPPELTAGWTATVTVLGGNAFVEPYGVAVSPDGITYVADGAGANRIHQLSPTGAVTMLAGGDQGFADGRGTQARFHTPSGLTVDAAGTVYVADTGNNAIRRVTRDGSVSTVAVNLNGPLGITTDGRGRLIASDSYNDRLVMIAGDGAVTPLSIAAPLDTPTALALDASGTLYVADTGNDVIRAIAPSGLVSTFDAGAVGGLRRPSGVTVDSSGVLYVTDASSRVIEISPALAGHARVVAGFAPGFRNGLGAEAQFREPAGLVALTPGRLIVADSGNGLVRRVTATSLAEAAPPPSPLLSPRFDVEAFTWRPLLWPLDPLHGPFEIAGTLGEARGEDAGRFHAGIDVRADNGSSVLAVREGVVRTPLATGDFGSLNEWLRIGDLTYVHLRAGRTLHGDLVDRARFVATRDEAGRLVRVRVKRGAHFNTGDVVGSVNAFNHVHLNVGWGGEEYNPLLFRLVQFDDTVPPTIARGGVRLYDANGTQFVKRSGGRLEISGPVQVVVDAWDQADGNRPNRRLGVYALGYQVLHGDGRPVAGYEDAIETIRFDRLADPDASRLVYAPGSGIPFYGQRRTRFLYIVTNTFRDGVATEGVWDTSQLAPGDYILRVKVSDIRGNEARQRRDLPVRVTGRAHTTGG